MTIHFRTNIDTFRKGNALRSGFSGLFQAGRRSPGFTIPEMLVAFTIFSVVIAATSVIFINISRSYRIAAGFLNAQNTLRYTMELISREVKEGTNFSSPSGAEFDFIDKKGVSVSYFLENGQLMRRAGGLGNQAYSLTDNRLVVTRFTPLVAPVDPLAQPRVTFLVSMVPKGGLAGQGDLAFTLQTTITQRKIITQ